MVRWICLLLGLCSASAHADVTATYNLAGLATIVIEAADSGAARAVQRTSALPGNPEMRIYSYPDGREYMAWKQDDRWVVARTQDIMAVVEDASVADRQGQHAPGDFSPQPIRKFVEQGEETVGGRRGKRYILQKSDGSTKGIDVVISYDPTLAPIGRFFARSWSSSLTSMSALMDQVPQEIAQMKALLEAGTLIRMGRIETLTKAEVGTVDPADFILPAEPASRDEVLRLMTRSAQPPARR